MEHTPLPDLGAGLHAEDIFFISPFYKDLASLLEEVLTLPGVNSAALLDVSSKFIYGQFTATLPPPQN
jgi:hypothetical protein